MQTVQEVCTMVYTAQLGYGLVEGANPVGATVPMSEAMAGLHHLLPDLVAAGATARRARSEDAHKRRQRVLEDWDEWAGRLTGALRPSLGHCTPLHVVAFLERWQREHEGRWPAGMKDRLEPGEKAPVAPGTLRQTAMHLKMLCRDLAHRHGPWREDHPRGNPCEHHIVADYLQGYEMAAFEDWDYAASGAVPLRPAKYWALVQYLREQASRAPTAGQATLLYRDLCALAYMWEVGCRARECGRVLLEDFRYDNLACEVAWPDLEAGALRPGLRVLVESSLGTKTAKNKHPGVIALMTEGSEEGPAVLVTALQLYADAARRSGQPLQVWLFRPATGPSCDGFSKVPLETGALPKRLQRHLKKMGVFEGETIYSVRRGTTQEAKAGGASLAEIAERQLWASLKSAALYAHPTRHWRKHVEASRARPADEVGHEGEVGGARGLGEAGSVRTKGRRG